MQKELPFGERCLNRMEQTLSLNSGQLDQASSDRRMNLIRRYGVTTPTTGKARWRADVPGGGGRQSKRAGSVHLHSLATLVFPSRSRTWTPHSSMNQGLMPLGRLCRATFGSELTHSIGLWCRYESYLEQMFEVDMTEVFRTCQPTKYSGKEHHCPDRMCYWLRQGPV